jgi:hypothetical protein
LLVLLAGSAAGSAEARVPLAPARAAPPAATPSVPLRPQDRPDIVGSGHISRCGNVWVKTTNIGVIGNPFPELSGDPSAQWPGPSGIEYLHYVGLWVAARVPDQADPTLTHRVSQDLEWRPPTLDPADRIYEAYGGCPGGGQLADDDGDGRLDEDRLDGRDNDGDGRVDEDFAAVSEQMFSLVMRDDTPEAQWAADEERHVPIGLEAALTTYAFSAAEVRDGVYFELVIRNVSAATLDSVFVGFLVDQDVGPVDQGRYFADDVLETSVPQGPDPAAVLPFDDPLSPNAPYREVVRAEDPKYQPRSTPQGTEALCGIDTVHVNGFTMADAEGDGGRTRGACSFLLLDQTLDGLGWRAPRRVGFRMFSVHRPGLPYAQGGPPTSDQERFELLASTRGIDPATGLIATPSSETADDYSCVCSVGPYLKLRPGATVRVVWALTVQEVDYSVGRASPSRRYHEIVENAVAAQLNYNGRNTVVPGVSAPTAAGRESALRADPGGDFEWQDCRDLATSPPSWRVVTSTRDTWFDLDCNYCTGVSGHIPKRWISTGPPPSPHLELAAGDRRVLVRWDNLSEYTPDRSLGTLDFAGYRVWKASDWTRPQGTVGPDDTLWELLGTYHYYGALNPLIEKSADPVTGDTVVVRTADVLVNRNWRPGSPLPRVIHPLPAPCLPPAGDSEAECDTLYGARWGFTATGRDTLAEPYPVAKYGVGRYELADPLVRNGFQYFYSVTAFDSSGRGSPLSSLEGRRSAIEGLGVTPQAAYDAAENGGHPYVVPNPYRGGTAWDLTPNATDPSGTHVDFFNLPAGWRRIRIFTLAGDLVQEIAPQDLRSDGRQQQEDAADAQASWDLISRNGQDVASGIYLFAVESEGGGMQQGKFVVIR